MKKILSAILCVAVLLSSTCVTFAADEASAWDGTIAAAFAGGDGTAENPYQISNGAELAYFASLVNNATDENRTQVKGTEFQVDESTTGILNPPYVEHYLAYTGVHFVLTNDIDLGNTAWTPIGNIDGDVKNLFDGNFDGGEHVIKNVKIDTAMQFVGFFGVTGRNSVIKNVGIDGVSYSYANDKSNAAIGGMVGFITGGTIENSFVRNLDINITGNKATGIGGLFGIGISLQYKVNTDAVISNCYTNNVKVTAEAVREETGAVFGRTRKNIWYNAAIPENAYNDASTPLTDWSNEGWSEINYTFTNVYAGNFESVGASSYFSFGSANGNTAPVVTNCYAVTTGADNSNDLVTTASSKDDIVSALVGDDSAFAEDNASEATNEGYPVLAWEVNWDNNVASCYAGGTGTEADPYLISNAAELMYFASMVNNATDDIKAQVQGTGTTADGLIYHSPYAEHYRVYTGKYFKLTNDIDLAGLEWVPIGNSTNLFDGNFEGDKHIVKNISVTVPHNQIGFFGSVGKNVTVKNLGLENVEYKFANGSGTNYAYSVGGMVGLITGGTFENCYVRNLVVDYTNGRTQGIGGFAGVGFSGVYDIKGAATITNCYVNGADIKSFAAGSTNGGFIGNIPSFAFDKDDEYFNNAADNSGKAMPEANWGNPGWFNINVVVNNCYVTDASMTITGSEPEKQNFYSFAYDDWSAITTNNCYTTMENVNNTGKIVPEIDTVSTQADIINGLVSQASGYSMDDTSINSGYPILNWEAERFKWDGSAATSFAGGTGTEDDPYLISNAAELVYFANMVNSGIDKVEVSSTSNPAYTPHSLVYTDKYFELTSDIDLDGIEWTPIGNAALRFNGTFNGNGHIVKNAKITNVYPLIGFFGYTGTNVTIKNLGIEEISINFHNNTNGIWVGAAGVLAGAVSGGNIENCYTRDSFIKNTSGITRGLGGFIGSVLAGQVGTHPTLNIKNCYSNNITVDKIANDYTGGFIGNMYGECLDGTNVNTPYPETTGNVTWAWWNSEIYVNIENCYAGKVTLSNVTTNYFAFARTHSSWSATWTATNCYSEATTANQEVYGTVQENKIGDPAYVTEAATAEIMAAGLITDGSEFKTDSALINGGYPLLSWESTEAEIPEMSIYGIDVVGGKVTGVTLENYVAVDGDKLLIAVYENGKLSAIGEKDITDEATSTYQTIALTEALTVPTGATIKAFIWDAAMQPLCNSLTK